MKRYKYQFVMINGLDLAIIVCKKHEVEKLDKVFASSGIQVIWGYMISSSDEIEAKITDWCKQLGRPLSRINWYYEQK